MHFQFNIFIQQKKSKSLTVNFKLVIACLLSFSEIACSENSSPNRILTIFTMVQVKMAQFLQ